MQNGLNRGNISFTCSVGQDLLTLFQDIFKICGILRLIRCISQRINGCIGLFGLWSCMFFFEYISYDDDHDSYIDSRICDIENTKSMHKDKICHLSIDKSFPSISYRTRQYQCETNIEVSIVFWTFDAHKMIHDDTDKERCQEKNTWKSNSKGYTWVFDQRETQKVWHQSDRSISKRSIRPHLRHIIDKNTKKDTYNHYWVSIFSIHKRGRYCDLIRSFITSEESMTSCGPAAYGATW